MPRPAVSRRASGTIVPKGTNRWLIRWFAGRDAAGKRVYESRTVLGTKTEAARQLAEAVADASRVKVRVYGAPIDTTRTVADYVPVWIDGKKAARRGVRTIIGYEDTFRRHITPVIGPRPLARLTPLDIRAVLRAAQQKGLGARTQHHIYAALKNLLRDAKKTGALRGPNPIEAVDAPSVATTTTTRRAILSAPECHALVASARTAGDPLWFAWWLVVVTGIRPGELQGLQWGDLTGTPEAAVLTIRRAVTWSGRSRAEAIAPVKDKAVRSLSLGALPDGVTRGHAHEFIVPHPEDGPLTWMRYQPLRDRAAAATARIGRPDVTLYGIRHTTATLLLAAGVDLKTVSARHGHSSVALTGDTYGHVLDASDRQAAGVASGWLQDRRSA